MAEHLNKNRPTCYVIAGPNGAGKTTFAMHYLPRVAKVAEFVNADAIARGLSPLNEQAVQLEAGRIFLRRIDEMIQRGRDFAFETTLSGLGYAILLRLMRKQGYWIELNYLWIPSARFSAQRVASRVASGGHDIPADAIARRYAKSLRNLVRLYLALADYAAVWDNSGTVPRRVCEQDKRGLVVFDVEIWNHITEYQS